MSVSIFVCVLISQIVGGPSEASARYALRRSPRIRDLTGSVTRSAYSASSGGCAREGCACGVPPELLQDSLGSPLAYVALNVQNTAMSSRKLSRPIPDTSESIGMFSNGQNCGRWVEITHGVKCVRGKTDPSRQPPVVCGVDASFGDPRFNYAADSKTRTKTYALVADGCSDDTFWCRDDVFHLGLSPSLQNHLCGADTACMDSRHVEWKFIDAAPVHMRVPESPQFAWHCHSDFPRHAKLVVYNVNRGISLVMAEGIAVGPHRDLGQQFIVPPQALSQANGQAQKCAISVEVLDIHGDSYGTFRIPVNSSYVAQECTGDKQAAQVVAGDTNSEGSLQTGDPTIFKQLQEPAAPNALQRGGVTGLPAARLTAHAQGSLHTDNLMTNPPTDMDAVIRLETSTVRKHGMIPPLVPLKAALCMPGRTNCDADNEQARKPQEQRRVAMETGVSAVTSMGMRGDSAATEGVGLDTAAAAWIQKLRTHRAGVDGHMRSTHVGLANSADVQDETATQDQTQGGPVLLGGNAPNATCSPMTRHVESIDEGGPHLKQLQDSNSCLQSSTAENSCSERAHGTDAEVSDSQTACSAGEFGGRQLQRTWGGRVRNPPRAGRACRPLWSQCGGKNYRGISCCEPGDICRFLSQWYSQCQPLQV